MDKLRQWLALSVAAAVAVLAGGWFLLVAPTRAEADALKDEVAAQELANAQVQTQLEVLRGKAEELPAKKARLAEVAVKLPADPALPDLLRALSRAASSAGVELESVAPGAPSPVVDAATGGAAPAPGAATPTAPAQGAQAGLMAVPLTIAVSGTFHDVESFVAELERLPRALRITGLTLSPREATQGGDGGAAVEQRRLSTAITGEVYLVAPAAPAAPPAPAGTATSGSAAATGASGAAAEPLPAAR